MPNEAASDHEALARRLYAALAEGDAGTLREILHPRPRTPSSPSGTPR
jgi:hypothetical protein